MKRSSFFKSIVTLVTAPKVLSELDIPIKSVNLTKVIRDEWEATDNISLLNEIDIINAHTYNTFLKKYGDKQFACWLETYSKT